MKQLIIDVLEDMSHGPSTITLSSPVFRETIAKTIIAAIRSKRGWVLDLNTYDGEPEFKTKEQKDRESWVCSICGKSTYDVDWDYIGSGTNHLGCELELEMKDDKKPERRAYGPLANNDRRKGDRREKNWAQKKHEEKVFNQDSSVDKLSEEIIDSRDIGYIYESPDSGKTIYRRKMGESKKELVDEDEWERARKYHGDSW